FLSFRDAAGRVFDFHALRHQYVSNLAAAGVHPKIAQTLARHSTIALTMNRYTHLAVHDLAASVNSLPALPVHISGKGPDVLQATGTDDQTASWVPTVVPRGAEFGAVLPASPASQAALDCTEESTQGGRSEVVSPCPSKVRRTNSRHLA